MPGVTNFDSVKLLTPLTATELGSNAVTTVKINAAAVTTAKIADTAVTTAKLATALQTMARTHTLGTVATTGVTEVLFRAPYTGTIAAASFVGKDALAQHASNFLTFAIRNYGAAGGGSTAVLAVSDTNTTKTSTGTAISAYTPFPLTLNGTPANLAVVKGDVLAFSCTSAATLANTITEALGVIEFTPS